MYMEATKPWACRINRYFGTSLGKSRENYAFGGTTVIELLIREEKKEKEKKKDFILNGISLRYSWAIMS